jgi:hypothetical protein
MTADTRQTKELRDEVTKSTGLPTPVTVEAKEHSSTSNTSSASWLKQQPTLNSQSTDGRTSKDTPNLAKNEDARKVAANTPAPGMRPAPSHTKELKPSSVPTPSPLR